MDDLISDNLSPGVEILKKSALAVDFKPSDAQPAAGAGALFQPSLSASFHSPPVLTKRLSGTRMLGSR